MALRDEILGQLKKKDATVKQLTKAIYGTEKQMWEKDVALYSQVLKVLLELKHEHRAWTINHTVWTITPKGKMHHG